MSARKLKGMRVKLYALCDSCQGQGNYTLRDESKPPTAWDYEIPVPCRACRGEGEVEIDIEVTELLDAAMDYLWKETHHLDGLNFEEKEE